MKSDETRDRPKAAKRSLDVLALPGDGIGAEVTESALAVLTTVAELGGLGLNLERDLIGGAAIDAGGKPIRESTLNLAASADAVLLGAVGGPKWDGRRWDERPEQGLLELRRALDVYANLRPVRPFAGLEDAAPIRPDKLRGVDFIVVRELVGGIYFGEPRGVAGDVGARRGFNTMAYTEEEIRRLGRFAFALAAARRNRLVSVDKANVLEVCALWRSVMTRLADEAPRVELAHMYVDNCAMQLVLDPAQFDVIVTSNMFGDILSDEAAALSGSLGMLPSASIGARHAIYEPVHGSAPDIAGKGWANPLAAILSVGMFLELTAGRADLARVVESAVERVLLAGLRTADLIPRVRSLHTVRVSTEEMGQAVVREIRSLGNPGCAIHAR